MQVHEEITKKNFNEKFIEVKHSLESAKFIGIDLEFSALYPLKNQIPSLFDSLSERYSKLRRNIAHVVPIQIGLTAFSSDPDKNSYLGTIYNFYLIPAFFPSIHKGFCFDSNAMSFLQAHQFDFNKFVYSGIPYMNKLQEAELEFKLKNDKITYVQSNYRNEINEVCEQEGIADWYNKAVVGEIFYVPEIYKKYQHHYEILYFIHKNIRMKFINVWTCIKDNTFTIEKVSQEQYDQLEKENSLEDELIDNLLGFTKVFRLLSNLKKPIVGHNFLHDILVMIESFENSLPVSYSHFKSMAIELFPVLYDTKCIFYSIQKILKEEKKWVNSDLESLFEYFKNGSGRYLLPNSPAVSANSEYNYAKFHQAGWDSFCTGFIFIQMAHLNIYQKYPRSKTFVTTELFAGLADCMNKVNVIRGPVSSIVQT